MVYIVTVYLIQLWVSVLGVAVIVFVRENCILYLIYYNLHSNNDVITINFYCVNNIVNEQSLSLNLWLRNNSLKLKILNFKESVSDRKLGLNDLTAGF